MIPNLEGFMVKFWHRQFTYAAILITVLALPPALLAQRGGIVFLVRHAEKISSAPDALLSKAGHQRAECLARTLRDAGIQAIYATEVMRTQQTAEPLAKSLNLKPIIIAKKDNAELVKKIRQAPDRIILVVAHQDTLPGIIERLGGSKVNIGIGEYNQLFIIRLRNPRGATISELRYCDCR